MFVIKGKYAEAKVYTDNVEAEAQSQLMELCNLPIFSEASLRIMPDVHAGKGSTIGFTSRYHKAIIPFIVGVDIGCGMLCVNLGNRANIDLKHFDDVVNRMVPAGFASNPTDTNYREWLKVGGKPLEGLRCFDKLVNITKITNSLGTLGGGNHFIELGESTLDGSVYLIIHTGSRNLGKQVAEIYQEKAVKGFKDVAIRRQEIIEDLKSQGRESEIQDVLNALKEKYGSVSTSQMWLCGQDEADYLHDLGYCQEYASANRYAIAYNILKVLGLLEPLELGNYFETIHNYIDIDTGTIRKGAVSAKKGEKLLIPLNMRDGSLICTGKGNADWNESAPHGAGRLMSRSKAKELVKIDDFVESMKGIYTTSVCQSTLDESPFAYKDYREIMSNIIDTVDIDERLEPIYNFKAK